MVGYFEELVLRVGEFENIVLLVVKQNKFNLR